MDIGKLEQLATASLTEAFCPPSEKVAAYALGLLTGNDQLVVAAHLRTCPLCAADIAAARPPEPRPRTFVARLAPPRLTEVRRSSSGASTVQQFVTADTTIDLTIAPPSGDVWRMTGQVTREGNGLAERSVTIRSGRLRYQQVSDAQGFFAFHGLPAGRYTLSVLDGRTKIQIRDIVLSHDAH